MAHQIDESKPKYLSQTRFMSGRRIIKTSVTEITDENVVDVLRKALATHELSPCSKSLRFTHSWRSSIAECSLTLNLLTP